MAAVEFLDLSGEIHEAPRGFSFFPWRGCLQVPRDLLETFHLVSVAPGQVRGNHLHPAHKEYLFAFHGPGVLLWEGETGGIKKHWLKGNRTLAVIPPGTAHALRNPGPEVLYLLAWRERVGTEPPEQETIPRPLA